jgi:hypothetical protein
LPYPKAHLTSEQNIRKRPNTSGYNTKKKLYTKKNVYLTENHISNGFKKPQNTILCCDINSEIHKHTPHVFFNRYNTAFAAAAAAVAAASIALYIYNNDTQQNQPKTSYPFDPLPRPTYILLYFGFG